MALQEMERGFLHRRWHCWRQWRITATFPVSRELPVQAAAGVEEMVDKSFKSAYSINEKLINKGLERKSSLISDWQRENVIG